MMARALSPWIRLEANYATAAKVRRARAAAIWPWVLCRLKDGGGVASDDDIAADMAALDLDLDEDFCADRLDRLKRGRLLVPVDGGWTTPNWHRYQPPSTKRTRRARENNSEARHDGTIDALGRLGTAGTPWDAMGRPGTPEASQPSRERREHDGTGRDGTVRDKSRPSRTHAHPPAREDGLTAGRDSSKDEQVRDRSDSLGELPAAVRPLARSWCAHIAAMGVTTPEHIEAVEASGLAVWHRDLVEAHGAERAAAIFGACCRDFVAKVRKRPRAPLAYLRGMADKLPTMSQAEQAAKLREMMGVRTVGDREQARLEAEARDEYSGRSLRAGVDGGAL